MSGLGASTDSFINSFSHLKGRPKSDQALPMLQKIASLVKPIMRAHRWKLPVLAEFFPQQDNLLGMNVNAGQKILLRLRPAHAPDTFMELDEVVQTMLHELTHNVHGPHDDKFYKFLSELQDEYDKLVRSGYAGEGFFSKGNRVGMDVSHNLPPHMARAKALEAAEKRRRMQVGDGGGRRLGGSLAVRPGMSPRELAAMAAERRARDEKMCGQGERAEEEATKAADESIIDLTGDSDESDDEVIIIEDDPPLAGSSKRKAPMLPKKLTETSLKRKTAPPERPRQAAVRKSNATPPATGWACSTCTLVNKPSALQCDACMTTRPIDRSMGWTCLTCGEGGISPDFWTCTFCGTMKTSS